MTNEVPGAGPVAPEFVGYRRGRPRRVTFDAERSMIVTFDEKGRETGAVPWTEGGEPLRIDGDEFVCQYRRHAAPLRLDVRDDDYPMALAFVEFVNRRRPRDAVDALGEPISGATRFQYAVVNVGTFDTPQRMTDILARAGSSGWELITVYDKSSNWFGGLEKGFMLLKRQVPDGVEVSDWCIMLRG